MTDITCKALFDFKGSMAEELVGKALYPWEILRDIGSYVAGLAKELKGRPGWKMLGEDIAVHESVKLDPGATVLGPAVIGPDAEVRPGAYIRGKVLVCGECVVGNSTELKNAVLMEGAKVPHYNYVGDSILGRGAHMGAGALASNLKLDGSNIRVSGVDTGLRKFGAALGDGAQVGCHAVLNPGSIICPGAMVFPLVSFRGIAEAGARIKE